MTAMITLETRIRALGNALKPFAEFVSQSIGEDTVIVAGPTRIEGSTEKRSLIMVRDIDRARRVLLGGPS